MNYEYITIFLYPFLEKMDTILDLNNIGRENIFKAFKIKSNAGDQSCKTSITI